MNAVTDTLAEWRDSLQDFLPDGSIRKLLALGVGLYLRSLLDTSLIDLAKNASWPWESPCSPAPPLSEESQIVVC